MHPLFISLTVWDILDILLVAFLLYQVYKLVKGTIAVNIFAGFFTFYLTYSVVKALNLELLTGILGPFIGLGLVALVIVFAPEVRRFLLIIGTKYNINKSFKIETFFNYRKGNINEDTVNSLLEACKKMSETKTGALIVLAKGSELYNYASTGEILKARISSELIQNIFFKNSPLHDGGMIISGNKILAARCILPVSENLNLPGSMGLRHRAAIGMSQHSNAHIIVVSEETGNISYVMDGHIKVRLSLDELKRFLYEDYSGFVVH